MLQNQLGA